MVSMPVALDLCCGDGGFTDGLIVCGFYVIGIDIVRYDGWKGHEFIQADLLTVSTATLADYKPVAVMAGPPCEEFSRHSMPWTRKRNPPAPSTALIDKCFELARDLSIPIVLENVREAQKYIGKAAAHYGPHYLWGDVPAMLPNATWYSKKPKESFSSSQRHLRARIPRELSVYLAERMHRQWPVSHG